MKSLIRIVKNEALITKEAADKIANYEKAYRTVKEQYDNFKAELLQEMEAKGVIGLSTDEVSVTYIPESDRETLDTKALKQDLPELFDDYVKMTKVKSSIRIRVK